MHAYNQKGEARHKQLCGPKAKNPERDTNISDCIKAAEAFKSGKGEEWLFPSVTEYIRVLSAPGLENYKLREVVKACYASPPIGGEDVETYSAHILDAAKNDASGAADLGTQIHNSLERYFTEPLIWDGNEPILTPEGQSIPCREYVLPAVQKMDELGIIPVETERILVNPTFGYAGTADVIGTSRHNINIIADYKSKRTKKGKPAEPNESHPLQIAAYWRAAFGPDMSKAAGCNIYISTTEIGRVDVKQWNAEELMVAWSIFECCLSIYRWRTGYDARMPKETP